MKDIQLRRQPDRAFRPIEEELHMLREPSAKNRLSEDSRKDQRLPTEAANAMPQEERRAGIIW